MAEDFSENTSHHSSGEGSGRHHHHSHRSHHHHSQSRPKRAPRQETPVQEESRGEGRYKFRIEQQHKVDRWKNIESTLTKHFLKIIGAIFLLNGIWFIVNSSERFRHFFIFIYNSMLHFGAGTEGAQPASHLSGGFNISLVLFVGLAVIIFLVFRISVRKRNFELGIIAFLSWVLLAFWWIVKIVWESDVLYLMIGYFVIATIFFIAIYYTNLLNVFPTRKKLTRRIESGLIYANFLFYFSTGIMMMKFLMGGYGPLTFIFVLAVGSFIPVYFAARKHQYYNRLPYMISIAMIACFVLPLLIRINFSILFLAPLSVFFLLISKSTRHQTSILFSIGTMLILIMIYLFQWVFDYIPGGIINNIQQDRNLFLDGLVAGLAIIPALVLNNRLLKKLTISVSSKLFNRSAFRKILKGITLGVIFLWGFWIFNYAMQYLVAVDDITYLLLFTYSCIYFIVLIPYLYKTGSSYLRFVMITAVVMSLIYPSIIHVYNLKFRALLVQNGSAILSGFGYHYLNLLMLILLLGVIMKYKTKAFARKKNIIRGFWVYFILMVFFMVITEFHHLVFLLTRGQSGYTTEYIDKSLNLYDSIILIFCTAIFLIIGFRQHFRFLRVFALVIFGCELIKILAIDIYFLENGMREIVFIVLGATALGLSVFYPKIKRQFFRMDSKPAEGDSSDEPV